MKTTSLLALLALSLAACSSDTPSGTSGGTPREGSVRQSVFASRDDDGPAPRREPDMTPRETRVSGTPAIRVTWEALAVEIDQIKNPRTKRRAQIGFGPVEEYKVVLVNESHPDAPNVSKRSREAEVAVLPDRDMLDLVRGLERADFFEHAQPTASLSRLFGSERSRGRVTVERGEDSVTLLSMKGLGLDERTKAIPGIYADAKAAITMLKNSAPSLSVKTYGTEPVRPPIPGSR
jgi:hypothetical protein